MSELFGSQGWKTKRYRTATCEVDEFVTCVLEARYPDQSEDFDGSGDEDDAYLDCRLIFDGQVVMQGQELVDYGQSIGEYPFDAAMQYVQKYLQDRLEDPELTIKI